MQQVVDLEYIIISKHMIFRSYIRKWMRQPEIEKMWVNFKQTFTEARQELRDTDATVDEFGFHSTNTIVTQIFQQLREEISLEQEKSAIVESAPVPIFPGAD